MTKNKIVPTILTAFLVLSVAAQAEVKVPSFPKTGKTLNDFVPSGWKVLKKTEGDLNKDNLPDLAVILASNVEDTNSDDAMDAPRPLLILFKQADGSLLLSAVQPAIVMCKQCGGVFGDPLEDFTIERGTVVLKHYGGSNDKWGSTYRFRFQDGDWFLIGKLVFNHNGISGEHHEKDENLLTGDVVETNTDTHSHTTTKKYKEPKAALKKMSEAQNDQ